MTRKPPSDIREILQVLMRRKLWILGCVLIIPPLVFIAGRHWPKKYRSETMILVDPQKIPEEYVKATITGDVTDRLQTISEEVMSRTRLLMIASKNGLYQTARKKFGDDSAVSALRKDITVEIIKGVNDHSPIDGFKIDYVASTPQLAQTVTQQIAALFIEENIKERDQDAQGTQQFIENQLVKARADLSAQDARIRDFKAAHLGTLPEQEGSNLAMISEYQSLAQQNSDAIDRANQQKVYLQSMLNVNGPQKSAAIAQPPSPLQLQLSTAEDQLAAASQKYTDSHPDVIRLKYEVATLRAQLKRQPAGASHAATASGPSIGQQLESQLLATEQEIKSRADRQQELQRRIEAVQSKVQSLPAVQQEYESLSRDYGEMQKNYDSLLEKEQASGMAAELERHNESERFQILDPASYPSAPYFPNLQIVNAAGIAGALILGLALAFLAEMRDPTIHNSDEAEIYLSAPLIIALPAMRLDKVMPQAPRGELAPVKGT
ncbi:MAG TPA: Wzz/FepE/Etk N-terminal domain-containing protein [Silvibacterium sp.]|nr:Wzz/FepE/Etk N-terminal domain-containing protein [Silvibacterium sp.]